MTKFNTVVELHKKLRSRDVTAIKLVKDSLNYIDQTDDQVKAFLSTMTEKALQNIVAKAQERWEIADLAIIHRVGALRPSDQIVLVSVLSSHRTDAFDACEFAIDTLKVTVPIWKREVATDGAYWVDDHA